MPRCTENEMPTLSEYFLEEARELLNALEQAVTGRETPDAAALHRAARGLRGTAQMAREERMYRAAAAFENVTRGLAAGALEWSRDMTARALDTVADLRALLDRADDDENLDARAAATATRWSAESSAQSAPARTDETGFHEFAAREAAGIADILDQSIQQLQADPMDREPLRAILRRQRALLGAARLEQIPVVAEVLRAIEDLTRVIAKLDVGVKKEWLDIFRVARDGLHATIASLVRGENPEPTHAVSRLRHMRAELLERYGEGETVSAAHETERLVQATPVHAGSGVAPAAPAHADEPRAHPETEHEMLELMDAAADDEETVLDLTETVEDEGVLELTEAVEDEGALLDLSEAAVVDDGSVLELTTPATGRGETLEPADTMMAEDELVLDSGSVVAPEDAVLGLTDTVPSEDVMLLELSDAAPPDGALTQDSALSREDALRRALELHATIARVAAHDPQARQAVDRLFDLIRTALG
jgi:chemotaxis protein histidine kinase CheA